MTAVAQFDIAEAIHAAAKASIDAIAMAWTDGTDITLSDKVFVAAGWIDDYPDAKFPAISIYSPTSEDVTGMSGFTSLDLEDENDSRVKIGEELVSIQIDVWATSKAERRVLKAAIKKWFAGRMSSISPPYCRLTLTNYHNAPVHLCLNSTADDDSGVEILKGRWQSRFLATAYADRIVEHRYPPLVFVHSLDAERGAIEE
jgi:hypothetical protein